MDQILEQKNNFHIPYFYARMRVEKKIFVISDTQQILRKKNEHKRYYNRTELMGDKFSED